MQNSEASHRVLASSKTKHGRELSFGSEEACPFDIICGRGRRPLSHEGNRWFHELISRHRQRYKNASKTEKTSIVLEIINIVHESGSRFLFKESVGTDCYRVAEDLYVRRKVSHAFRDGHSMKKDISVSKEQKTSQEQYIYPSNNKRYDNKNNERVLNEVTETPLRIQRETSEAVFKGPTENECLERFVETFPKQEKLLELQQSIFSRFLKQNQSEDTS
mmetsp:Transcript_29821/g.45722  ORF Transcript_29821/g.45722 Transcript_29821/m.45722 type:complete len:219 (+) Transcript_29821:119-775(+)